jgi:hypothetical protein
VIVADLAGVHDIDPGFEYFCPAPPADPQFRDSATLWVLEQSGAFALPRVTIDVCGEDWEHPRLQLNFVTRAGQTLRVWSSEPGSIDVEASGRGAARGAGALKFTCHEPFRRWALEYDGLAQLNSTLAEIEGGRPCSEAPLSFALQATMVAPPWVMGGANAVRANLDGQASALMGGARYEQLCRIAGWVKFDGERHEVDATGMRVRRQGVRNMAAGTGHCQHSAVFPSGRAFGAIVMAPGPEGPELFNEGFVVMPDGVKHAARVVQAPWMRQLTPTGDDATLVMRTEVADVTIRGTVLLSMFDHHNFEMADSSVLHQGTARYNWDDEETIGLIERCSLRDKLAVAAGNLAS